VIEIEPEVGETLRQIRFGWLERPRRVAPRSALVRPKKIAAGVARRANEETAQKED